MASIGSLERRRSGARLESRRRHSQTVIRARLWPLWRRNLVISILGLVTFWSSLCGSPRTVRNANRLRIAAERIASGDLSPPQGGVLPSLEFAQLQDAFVTMAAICADARNSRSPDGAGRKMNETLQSLQRQVVRQERLAAVGLLVSGVAHELNNPLQAILGTSEILERDSGLSPQVLEEISFVKTQSGRASDIIRNLSRFSTQKAGRPTLVDLRDVIGEVIQLRRTDLDIASVSLEVKADSARQVYASHRAEQVTLNFVINAQQAIESLGSKGRSDSSVRDGKKVRLEVLDNGPGVKPEDEPKLFQPASRLSRWGRNRPGTFGELRHHRIVRRRHRIPRQRDGRRDVFLRASRQRSHARETYRFRENSASLTMMASSAASTALAACAPKLFARIEKTSGSPSRERT